MHQTSPEAVIKIQEWMPPRNKQELQSFLGFAGYYRVFIPFHAAKVQPMQELLEKSHHFHWEERHQEDFDSEKQALEDATALAAPSKEGRFVLDTDASAVEIAGILHQEQEHNGNTVLRPILYGSKSLTLTQLHFGSSTEAGNVRRLPLHRKISFVPGRSRIYASRRQRSSVVAGNIFHGPSQDRPLDHTAGPKPLQDDPPTEPRRTSSGAEEAQE